MRLLPRTRCGTWLLGLAAWLALCALAWWVFPVQPRLTTTIPGDDYLLAVGSGGRTVTLIARSASDSGNKPVRIWDAADNSLRTIIPDRSFIAECKQSRDGRWIAFGTSPGDRDDNVNSLRILNLATGEADDWIQAPRRFQLVSFSPDGRWLALAEHFLKDEPGVRLWDLINRRPGILLPDLWDCVFSADGQRVAGSVHSRTRINSFDDEFGVYDLASGRELARWPGEQGFEVAALTPDGSGLIANWTGTDPVLIRRCSKLNVGASRIDASAGRLTGLSTTCRWRAAADWPYNAGTIPPG